MSRVVTKHRIPTYLVMLGRKRNRMTYREAARVPEYRIRVRIAKIWTESCSNIHRQNIPIFDCDRCLRQYNIILATFAKHSMSLLIILVIG